MEENDNAHPVCTPLRCVFFDGSIRQLILISQSVPSIPGRDHPRDGHWSDNATTRRSICRARPVKSVNYSNELLLPHVTSTTPQYAYGRGLMFYASAKGSQSRLQARKTPTAYFRPVVFILVSLMIPQTVRGRPRRNASFLQAHKLTLITLTTHTGIRMNVKINSKAEFLRYF